jgi:hypothetical protein
MAQGLNNSEQEKKMYWSLSLTDWQILALWNVHDKVIDKQIDKKNYMHALFCEIEQGN